MSDTRFSRRRFLQYGLAGGAALATAQFIGPFGQLAWADAPASGGTYPLGIQSYSLRKFPLDKMIATCKELGLDHIELFNAHLNTNASPAEIAEVKKKIEDAGLRISSHGVSQFTINHKANRKIFEFAKACGMKQISADPHPDSFDSLDKLVKEYDIRIAIHNHGPEGRYSKIADVMTAIKGHDQRVGACADLGHYIRSGEDPVKAIRLLQGRLYGVHLKDFDAQRKDAKGTILGKGLLDVDGVFQALKAVNFPQDGALVIEYEENPDNPVDDLKQCVAVARASMKKNS